MNNIRKAGVFLVCQNPCPFCHGRTDLERIVAPYVVGDYHTAAVNFHAVINKISILRILSGGICDRCAGSVGYGSCNSVGFDQMYPQRIG